MTITVFSVVGLACIGVVITFGLLAAVAGVVYIARSVWLSFSP
jgi:hypothetical protein